MNPISSLLSLIAKPKRLLALLSFNQKGYLHQIGWFNSFDSKSPVDESGNPIPWVTYSFIDFIRPRLHNGLKIFEFGSGNSTWFYAKNVKEVVSVEHDQSWFEKINRNKPANSTMVFCELKTDGAYCRAPLSLSQKFDVIIVDGRDRVNCCKQAVNALTSNGVIILDDSERAFYQDGIDFLVNRGFKEMPFSGISPGLFYKKSTSVFYQPDNCLGI